MSRGKRPCAEIVFAFCAAFTPTEYPRGRSPRESRGPECRRPLQILSRQAHWLSRDGAWLAKVFDSSFAAYSPCDTTPIPFRHNCDDILRCRRCTSFKGWFSVRCKRWKKNYFICHMEEKTKHERGIRTRYWHPGYLVQILIIVWYWY